MSALTVIELPDSGQAYSGTTNNELPVEDADATNGHTFTNDGLMFIVAKVPAAAVGNQSFTVESIPAMDSGRGGPEVVTVTPGNETILGPFMPRNWGYTVNLSTASAAADLKFVVIRPQLG